MMSAPKNVSDKLYSFSTRFIQILSLSFTALLLLSGFLCTCYSLNMETQQVLTKWDNPLMNLLGIAVFLLPVLMGLYLFHKFQEKTAFAKKVFLILASFWILSVGAVLIVFNKTVPAADAYSVYDIAGRLAMGDTSVIHPTDSYLSYYPQQIGLVAFFEPLIRFWNLLSLDLPAYHFLKTIYAGLGVVIFLFQYLTVHHLFKNDRTDFIFILLSMANLPFLLYTSFVYSEIPSFAAVSIGLYCFLRLLTALSEANKKNTWLYGCLALMFLTFSVQLRKNSLIIIIAVVLVTLLKWFKERKHLLLVFALLLSVCAISILPLIQKGYELRAHNTLKSGVTATSYFAMGMQESSRANGWYNGFNFNTYQESGMDSDIANEISRAAIDERLTYFKENPGYGISFYLGKFLSQWADGTYASRQATLATFGGRQPFFVELYEGKYSEFYIAYCNVFQNILYLGCFLFCLGSFRKKIDCGLKGLPSYIGLIAVFGGFLFHMLWEANSRYIFLYGMLMLPYAAQGIEWIFYSTGTISRKRTMRSSNCS